MNTKKLAMTIALGTLMTAASAGAMANSVALYETGSQWLQEIRSTPSTVTRAEVKNQVTMARQQGTLEINNVTYPEIAESKAAPRSRAAVNAEAIQSVKNGRASKFYIGA
jgi:hypothetical protein